MIVTELIEVSKAKSKVYIDHEFAFVLYKGELRIYKIKCMEEISEDTYQKIRSEVLPKRAKLRCMNLLKSRDYTRYELETKLKQGFYPADVIQEALDYVASYRYVDDERYARNYVTYAMKTKSKKQISLDLRKKGVDSELAGQILGELMDDTNEQEDDLIRKLLKKKKYAPATASYEEKKKIVGFLYRKGFQIEKIYRIMGEID